VHGLWIFAVNRADSQILQTQRIVDQLWILAQIPDSVCLNVRILGPKRDLDHRSFFILGRYVNEFIQIISFVQWSSFKQSLELYCVIVIKHVTIFTICAKLTMAFTFTSLLLNFYTSVSGCGCGFGFEQKILADRRMWRKNGTDRRICIPLFTPLLVARSCFWHHVESGKV